MSRYIDADAMLEYLELAYDNHSDMDMLYNTGVLVAINYIKHKADTIDIVRCKECKHFEKNDSILRGEWWCDLWADTIEDDGYCSYGEREGE